MLHYHLLWLLTESIYPERRRRLSPELGILSGVARGSLRCCGPGEGSIPVFCRPGWKWGAPRYFKPCMCIGRAAETRHLLRWHWGLKKGSGLGIGFCRLHPRVCGCPLHRTPVGRVSVCLQAGKLRRGEWARGEGLPGRRVRGTFPAPLVEREPGCFFESQALTAMRYKCPGLYREARWQRGHGARPVPPACWEERVLPARHLSSKRWCLLGSWGFLLQPQG